MRLNKTAAVLIAFSFTLFSAVTSASEQEGQWYVNGLLTYAFPDSDRNLDDGFGGGQVSVGKAISRHLNIEGEVDYMSLSGDGSNPDADFFGVGLNGMYLWNRERSFTPYVLAGVGYLDYEPDGSESSKDLQLQAGPGFLWDLGSESWSLRAEALARWADDDKQSAAVDYLINVGVQFAFGGKSTKSQPAAQPAEKAAVAAAPVAAAALPADGDGDGVPDERDECLNTPAGYPVDAQGCALDDDKDGVANPIDECPDTLPGAKVDERGCGYEFTLSGANFATNSAELTQSGQESLEKVAQQLKVFGDVDITIEGHTDSQGQAQYNLDLSTQRAKAARDFLVRKGISQTRITYVGKGEAEPIASNDTEEGRALNRRVVLKRNQ